MVLGGQGPGGTRCLLIWGPGGEGQAGPNTSGTLLKDPDGLSGSVSEVRVREQEVWGRFLWVGLPWSMEEMQAAAAFRKSRWVSQECRMLKPGAHSILTPVAGIHI